MKVMLTDICRPKQWKTIAVSDLNENGYWVYGANGIIGQYKNYNHEESVIMITYSMQIEVSHLWHMPECSSWIFYKKIGRINLFD